MCMFIYSNILRTSSSQWCPGMVFFSTKWPEIRFGVCLLYFATGSPCSPGWPLSHSAAKTDFESPDHPASRSPSAATPAPVFWFSFLEFPSSPAVFKKPCILTPRKALQPASQGQVPGNHGEMAQE